MKHHWPKSEARRLNNEVTVRLIPHRRFDDQSNNSNHKYLYLNDKCTERLALYSSAGELARMLISGENRGEYTEE